MRSSFSIMLSGVTGRIVCSVRLEVLVVVPVRVSTVVVKVAYSNSSRWASAVVELLMRRPLPLPLLARGSMRAIAVQYSAIVGAVPSEAVCVGRAWIGVEVLLLLSRRNGGHRGRTENGDKSSSSVAHHP